MKVLHVIESLGFGGAEMLLVNLLPELQRQGDAALVAVLRPPFDLRPELETSGIRVVPLSPRGKWSLILAAQELSTLVRRERIDLVHAHLYFPSVIVAISRILRMHGARCVVTFHNLAYSKGVNKAGLGLVLRRKLASYLYPRGFDGFIAVSSAVAGHYRQHLGVEPISVLHNPVPKALEQEPAGDDLQAGASPRLVSILVPGRLVHEKGHVDLLEAVSILRQEGRRFLVVLVGDGPLRDSLASAISEKDLAPFVTLAGRLSHPELLAAIRDSDIVAVPSRFEGFGLAALEGMALGKPVVATDAGGLPEVVEDGVTGWVVPARAPTALASALRKLMDDPALRHRMGLAGLARSRRQFALSAIVDRLRGMYRRACQRPGEGH